MTYNDLVSKIIPLYDPNLDHSNSCQHFPENIYDLIIYNQMNNNSDNVIFNLKWYQIRERLEMPDKNDSKYNLALSNLVILMLRNANYQEFLNFLEDFDCIGLNLSKDTFFLPKMTQHQCPIINGKITPTYDLDLTRIFVEERNKSLDKLVEIGILRYPRNYPILKKNIYCYYYNNNIDPDLFFRRFNYKLGLISPSNIKSYIKFNYFQTYQKDNDLKKFQKDKELLLNFLSSDKIGPGIIISICSTISEIISLIGLFLRNNYQNDLDDLIKILVNRGSLDHLRTFYSNLIRSLNDKKSSDSEIRKYIINKIEFLHSRVIV